MQEKNSSLKDLFDLKSWQKIQDNFAAITGIGIRTLDPKGNSLINISAEPRLCSQLLKTHKQKILCGECLPTFLNGDAVVDKNLAYSCEAGLTYFVVPLRLENGKVLGYVILGPVVLIGRKSKEEYEAVAEKLYLSLEEFWSAFIEIKVVSLQAMQSLVGLVSDVSKYVINLSFKNALKEKGSAPDLAYPKLKNILSVLLEVAFDISHADIGSVMFVDESRQNLTIQASRGIPDDITKKTRVRIGEGIAGMAARDGHSFLIDENTQNTRIKPYLSRPYLGSSMVLPIKVKERVVGVMNLGTLKNSLVKFDHTNVQAMDKLLGLVAAAVSTSL